MKNVFITGVGRGIGKGLAQKYLEEGCFVYGTTLSGSADYTHENLHILKLDLSSGESIDSCIEIFKNLNKKIDVIINNAGVLHDDAETKIVMQKLRSTMEVNFFGTVDFMEKLLEYVNESAQIVFISSSAGSISRTGEASAHYPNHYPAYKISKCAINMYMRTLAMREKNKFVNSIHPGRVQTDLSGFDGDMTPAEAATEIFKFISTNTESGYFWFEGGKMDW